jgi:hypothetical protein
MAEVQSRGPSCSSCGYKARLVIALLGLSGWLCTEAIGSEAVDNAFRLCAVMEKTGLTTECKVSGWGSTVDVRLDTTGAEARKMCAAMVDLLVQQKLSFGGKWKLRLFSPYSGEHPIAVCTLK